MKNFILILVAGFINATGFAQLNQMVVGANNNGAIMSANLNGSSPTEINTGIGYHSFYNAEFHSGNNKVYMSWYYGIYSMDLDGSNLDTLYYYPSGGMGDGIDVDEANGHIYFTNTQTDYIYRMNLNGANLIQVYGGAANVNNLSDVKVDIANGYVYFGEFLASGALYRIDTNGTNEVTIVPGTDTRNIHLDVLNNHIYYVKYTPHELRRCDLNGTNDTLLLSGFQMGDIDIDFGSGTIFIADMSNDKVVSCDLLGGNFQELIQPTDIYFNGDPLESPHGLTLVDNPAISCSSADTPVLSGPASYTMCPGDSITITWTGNLYDNDYWVFFDDDAGTYDTITGNSITVPANQWGYYEVWGSGTCANGGTGELEVFANPGYSIPTGTQRICYGDSLLIFGQYESVSGTYTDSLQTVAGCDSLLHFELIVDQLTDQIINPSQYYVCDSGSVTIDMAASEDGINYYLREDATNSIVDGPITGNGSGISFNTGMVASTTNYNVYGERLSSYGVLLSTDYEHLDGGLAATFQQNNVTFEFWVKWDGDTNGGKTMIVNGNEGYNGYSMKLLGSDSTLYVLYGGVGYLYTNTQLIPNTWTHLAVTGNSSNLWTYYINGDSIASTYITPNSPYDSFRIGASSNGTGSQFDGVIDDVRVWETARTQAEIQANMTNCLTGSEPFLKAYYTFENAGEDLTANNKDLIPTYYDGAQVWGAGVDHCNLMCGTEMNTIATVTIVDVDPTVSVSGITLTANQTGATYQWVDCNNGNAPIAGETNQDFTPTTNGSYAVEVTLNGCTETSSCENITTIGLNELDQNMNLLVYPNPNNGSFTLELGGNYVEEFTIEVKNLLGQTVYSTRAETGKKLQVNLEGVSSGVYIVRVNSVHGQTSKQVIVH